jgi:hypothetical protein
MSSPIQDDGDLDPILRYAPPRVRERGQPRPEPSAPAVDRPARRQSADSPEIYRDRGMVEMRHRLTLDPEWIPEPPRDTARGRDLWTLALHASGALGIAALLAWVLVSVPGATQLGRDIVRLALPGTLASTQSGGAVPPSGVISPNAASSIAPKARPEPPNRTFAAVEPPVAETSEWIDPRERAAPAPPGRATKIQPAPDQQTPPAEQTAPAPAREAPAQQAVLDFVTRHLDSDELASLLQRADDFIKSRDISSARLLLRRAAEAGNVRATIKLAGTFDPNVLKTLGFQEGAADIAQARLWYERAEKSGSAEAPGRLQQLATTSIR